jgi:hypothetical protein
MNTRSDYSGGPSSNIGRSSVSPACSAAILRFPLPYCIILTPDASGWKGQGKAKGIKRGDLCRMVVVDAILLLLEVDNWSIEIGNIRTWREAYRRIQMGDVLVVLLSGIRDFLNII